MSAEAHQRIDGLTAFSPDRPLLLLTDFPPEAKGGGAVILRSLLTDADRRSILWVTLSERGSADDNVISLSPPHGRSLLRDATVRGRLLRRALRSIMHERSVRAGWVVAHGAALRVGAGIVGGTVPVHATVHDDPAYLWLTRRYPLLAPLLGRDLRSLLRGARSLDVVSRPMAERYREFHAGEITIVHRGLGDSVVPSPAYGREELSVAVLGSTYGFSELKVLGEALERASERLDVPVTLTVIGGVDRQRLRRNLPPKLALDAPGHLDEKEGIERLRGAFLLYLNYPFRSRGKMLRTMSYPTKLSTYVLAARPILMHMPADSSVVSLRRAMPYATLWDSLTPDRGAEILDRLWREGRMRESFHDAAEAVRARNFDLTSNRRALLGALNSLAS